MTRATHGRFVKDQNDVISDHLRNHVHLTNCIHLRNHMHRQSPILAERSLMRDLIVLQKSRSLRDPSASPPSWHSPSIVESMSRKIERDSTANDGRRRSVGRRELQSETRWLPGNSPPFGANMATSRVAAEDVIRGNDGTFMINSSTDVVRDAGGIRGEDSSRKSHNSHHSGGPEVTSAIDGQSLVDGKMNIEEKRTSRKGKQSANIHLKTIKEQLKDLPFDNDDGQSSQIHLHGRRKQEAYTHEESGTSKRSYRSELNRGKKRQFRGVRRSRPSMGSRGFGGQNELSVASNSLAPGSSRQKYYMDGREEGEEAKMDVTRGPRNGCGIPWNWSRIHHRGKTFLDLAGRSLSCGLSESRLRKEGSLPEGRDDFDMAVQSGSSSSCAKFHAEAAPLLDERSGSQGSIDNAAWVHSYSGELGLFADHSLKNDVDSDIASEAQSEYRRSRGYSHGRHQSLTQKYTPRTFRDLIGQNLVVQALSNAVLKRKVGFLYVFYGPHGTGKTSCARVFARALSCQSLEHSKPCGMCNSCVAHDLGKSPNVREVGPVGTFDFESVMDLLDTMVISQLQSQYRVFIFDDCDTLTPDSWNAISKVIDRAPRRVVFILVSKNLDHMPHIIMSRCQKFFFPKLKDADIIYTLQWIATKEGLEIDKDAIKLVASRSDGSLRDAQMTLEQLSLLGQRISVPLVQELVGLVSDEKLVDLLDLALSADTVNTVKNLREIMEAGAEPLALMSQLATIITDILAGSYVFTKERLRRKFFRRLTLSKEDMEKLRQALKTLSEAEKQLRTSNDKLTWLTAALLQLAPDKLYMLPSSSADTSFNHSPLLRRDQIGRNLPERASVEHTTMSNNDLGVSTSNMIRDLQLGSAADVHYQTNKANCSIAGGKRQAGMTPQRKSDASRVSAGYVSGRDSKDIEAIWLAVLQKIEINILKQFMHQEGKLVSVSFGAAPTVQLMFSSHLTKSKAEKFSGHILQAFESVLGSPVTIEIRCEAKKDAKGGSQVPFVLAGADCGTSQIIIHQGSLSNNISKTGGSKNEVVSGDGSKNEIVEVVGSPREPEGTERSDAVKQIKGKGLANAWAGEKCQESSFRHIPESKRIREQLQSQSLVRSKVSLAHVIQQAEGSQRNGWSRSKAISIAEKLEQENLRLEPKSRSLLCWKASRITRRKLSRLRMRTRRSRSSLLKFVPCGRCVSANSPR